MTTRSRVPDSLTTDTAAAQFFDALDKRQMQLAQLSPLDSGASLEAAIAKINEIIATAQTR